MLVAGPTVSLTCPLQVLGPPQRQNKSQQTHWPIQGEKAVRGPGVLREVEPSLEDVPASSGGPPGLGRAEK
jgi:hypothetical protein